MNGAKASTTGNIYGIYGMSGGAYEYIAAYINNNTSGYGSSFVTTPGINGYQTQSTKYATVYPYTGPNGSAESNYNTYKSLGYGYGDAILETSSRSDTFNYNWFDDYTRYPVSSGMYFDRGASFSGGRNAGIFVFSRNDGNSTNNSTTSYRVVLAGN